MDVPPPRPKRAFLLLPVFVLLLMGGCVPARIPVRIPSEELLEPKGLLQRIEMRDRAVRSMQGMLNLQVRVGERRFRLEQAFQVEKPDKIRIETLGLFGQPFFFLVSDGSTLSAFLPEKRLLLTGSASKAIPSFAFPVPFRVPEIVTLLTGGIPSVEYRSARSTFDHREDLIVVDLFADPALPSIQRLWIDPKGESFLRGERFGENGQLLWRVTFDRFEVRNGISTPSLVRIETAEGPLLAVLELEEVEVNRPLPEGSFRLSVPEGTEVRNLE